jgi:hypothetical protein
MKTGMAITAGLFGLAGLKLTNILSIFVGQEHEIMILAIGMCFLATGYFLGLISKNKVL